MGKQDQGSVAVEGARRRRRASLHRIHFATSMAEVVDDVPGPGTAAEAEDSARVSFPAISVPDSQC